MRVIPAEIQTLLKSKSMVGGKKPSHEVIIEGAPGGERDLMGEAIFIIQGKDETSYFNMSNFVPTNDGRFMQAYTDPGTNEVMIGYCNDESFLTNNYPLATILQTGKFVEKVTSGTEGSPQVSLYKRNDNTVLMLVADPGIEIDDEVNEPGAPQRIDCYISNSGNGDDFGDAYNIITIEQGPTHSSIRAIVSIPIKLHSGRLLFTSALAYKYSSTYNFPAFYWFISDDNGTTWSMKASLTGATLSGNSISQPAQIPSGAIYVETTRGNGEQTMYKSVDNADNWSYVTGDMRYVLEGSSSWNASYYYDAVSDILYRMNAGTSSASYLLKVEQPTEELVENVNSWQLVADIGNNTNYCTPQMVDLPSGRLSFGMRFTSTSKIMGLEPAPVFEVNAKSINISRTDGMAGNLRVTMDNNEGIYSPDNTESAYQGVFFTNKKIETKQGYGSELIKTFTGLIDRVDISTFPQELTVTARDKYKLALDALAVDNEGNHSFAWTGEIATAVAVWAQRAGLELGTVETTNIEMSKRFSWETYADIFQYCADLAGFESYVDEDGKFQFVKDEMPSAEPDYVFKEGEDIVRLGYTIDDSELYRSVVVIGQEVDEEGNPGEAIVFEKAAPIAQYGMPDTKKMVMQAREANTEAACEEIADRAIALIITRARVVDFAAVAVPWLQKGDVVQVFESSSTISEIYRIKDINFMQDTSGFIMQITAYWYAHPV